MYMLKPIIKKYLCLIILVRSRKVKSSGTIQPLLVKPNQGMSHKQPVKHRIVEYRPQYLIYPEMPLITLT